MGTRTLIRFPFRRRILLFALLAGGSVAACQSTGGLEPPGFEYGPLSERYFRTNPGGHFPLTIQRGSNLQPVTTRSGHMFYTSNVLGSGDIWIRDLGKTVNVPLIKHPAEQYKPAITPEGDRLVYVSEDQNPRGDLRLVRIDPEELIRNTLDGLSPQDLFEQSIDLSAAIATLAGNLPESCHNSAAETDPVWNHDGTLLAFASDRCNPGAYDVWVLEMADDAPQALRRLTHNGAVQPRFGPQSEEIVYVSYRAGAGGRIYIADLRESLLVAGSERELPLPVASSANPDQVYIYANPSLSRRRGPRDNAVRPGLTLYYTSIRADSNRNGRIDTADRGALFAYDIAPPDADGRLAVAQSGERQLLDDSAPLLSANHADLIDGMILYAARLFNSVNVYFVRPRGIIPLEASIYRQYQARETYAAKNPDRYLLALDAVGEYFGDQKEFLIYAGLIELERLRFYEARGQTAAARQVRERLSDLGERNPLTALQTRLADVRANDSEQTPALIMAFIESARSGIAPYRDQAAADTVVAAAYQMLAAYYQNNDRFVEALVAITFLNDNFPNFHLRDTTMLQQARLELVENLQRIKQARDMEELRKLPLIPRTYTTLLREIDQRQCAPNPGQTQDDCRHDIARTRELVHSNIYAFFYERRSPDEALELASFALGRESNQNLDAFLRLTLQVVRARALYDDKRYLDALGECTALLNQIPQVDPLSGGGPADGWRSIYIRAWQIVSYVHDQLGNFSEAYAAKLNYGGAYSRETAVSIDTQDFIDIIEESETYINLYLRTARLLSATVKENENVLPGNAIGAAIDAVTNAPIDIGGTEMDVIYEFCQPSSRNRVLFLSLGPSYDERYLNFCQSNYQSLENRRFEDFPIKSARTAADLLYIASYANASILNIMFLNIKKLGVLEQLYSERAVYYQRLKIDIAAEKNKRVLESRARDLVVLDQSDLVALVSESDPYDSRTYDELIYGYRTALNKASEIGDLSLLYGYAYILIKKNVEREAFYERLQNKAYTETQGITGLTPGIVSLPQSLLIEKKEEILRDLKHADYLLQYVLNVDPLNVDAYLLQGWLYQYIDERRTKEVRTVPTFLENIYYYATGSQPAVLSDGIFYADLYKNYFPENLYEANVELYRQALQKVEDVAPNQAVGNLHLNLANNYFKLLNFQRAVEHYEKAESYMNGSAAADFENYRQQALFHFNMGRALFYEGRLDAATARLQKAYDIYDEFERKPLHERFSTLNFMLGTARGDVDASARERRIQREKIKDILARSEEVRIKMALIAAIIGLAHWEAGRPDEAVLFYQDAILRLYENGGGSDSGALSTADGQAVVERASLMNFIALAYQSQRNFPESDERAAEAGRYARDRGLTRDDLRYEPQTLGGRALGCILRYGEDFSVIGDGRTPYGFSPLRQYHLSLGIQLENRVQQGDLEGAAYLLRQRRQVFQARDMDVRLGRQGFVATLNQEALNQYRAGHFAEAAEAFQQAAERARDFDFLQSFRQNYFNHFKALFAGIENVAADDLLAREAALDRIAAAIEEIEGFRNDYRDELRKQFIAQRTQEVPDYEYDEAREGPALREKLNQQLLDILSIEGTLYFYRGRLRMFAARARDTNAAAYADLNHAVERYDEALSVVGNVREAGHTAMRIRLNRARALLAAGRLQNARSALREIVEDTYEFSLIREEWLAHFLLAQVHDELHAVYGRPADRDQAAAHYQSALELLTANPHIYTLVRRNVDAFYTNAANFYVRTGEEQRALVLLERRWENYLTWQFYRNPLAFDDPALQRDYDLVRDARNRLRQLDESESALRMGRRSFARITERKRETREAMQAALTRMAVARPRLRIFAGAASTNENVAPRLSSGQTLLRLFYLSPRMYGTDAAPASVPEKALAGAMDSPPNSPAGDRGQVVAWCYSGTTSRFVRQPIEAPDPGSPANSATRRAVEAIGERCLSRQRDSDTFVIPDPALYGLDFEEIFTGLRPGQRRPAFSTRLTDDYVGFLQRGSQLPDEDLNLFNLRTGLVYNSDHLRDRRADIIGLRAWNGQALFPAGDNLLFDPRRWIGNRPPTSLAIVSQSDASFQRDGGIYEVLRATGTGTVAFVAGEGDDESLQHLADINRIETYGDPGRIPKQQSAPGDTDGETTGESDEQETELNEERAEQPGRPAVHRLLLARGLGPYTVPGTRVFGAAGHARRDFYEVLLRRHVAVRRKAAEAEAAGHLRRARAYYELAASYLQGHPHESDLRFENDLGEARLQVRLESEARGEERTARFDRLIARYEANRVKLPRIYDTAIETLLVENLSHIAQRYLSAYIARFPERKDEIVRKNSLLTFRSRLRSAEYGGGLRENRAFPRDFDRVYAQILANEDAIVFADNLIKHGQYASAHRLSEDLTKRASTRDAALRVDFEARADAYLLEASGAAAPALAAAAADNSEQQVLELLHHSLRANWDAYAATTGKIEAGLRRQGELALAKFRLRLYEQWQRYRTGHSVNILDVSNVTLQAGNNAYNTISRIERSMIFRLLIENLDYDPELQIARMLESLIETEGRVSATRTFRMALGAGEAFTVSQDAATASRFLQICVDVNDDTIPNANDQQRYARLGTALAAAGLVSSLRNNQSAWQRSESAEARTRRDRQWRERLVAGWRKTLTASGEQAVARLYERLPKNFEPGDFAEFQAIVRQSDGNGAAAQQLRREVPIALGTLKARALAAENWRALTDVGFFEQEYRNYLTARELRIDLPAPEFSPIASALLQKLPADQNFVALIDTPDSAIRVTYREQKLQGVRLKATGRYLRGRMHQYLIRQRTGEPSEEFRDELSRLYRSLFGIGQTGITYYWLGDVHALAPILPERGDRLFQILSPQAMISDARPQVLTGWEFSEDFTVRSIAPARATPKPRYRSPEEALFFDRLEKMEALSLGGTAQTPGTPRQLMELAVPTALPDFAGIPQNDSSAWFFSGNRLALASAREVDLYNLLLIRLGNALQGPGIVTIRMPATLDHARFVRHYYSRAIPARAIYRRFLTAGFNLRREGGDAYNYRLVTSNFLKE